MSGVPEPTGDVPPAFRMDLEPFAGFELSVLVDRAVYSDGDPVRITVTATNRSDRFVEHRHPGWQRCRLSVRDELHRAVADDRIERGADGPGIDRFPPGQLVILPTYWDQRTGPLVRAWSDQTPGPRAEPGRYCVRATWLGREPGARAELADAWSTWFTLV